MATSSYKYETVAVSQTGQVLGATTVAVAAAGVKGGGADGTPNQSIAINRVTVTN